MENFKNTPNPSTNLGQIIFRFALLLILAIFVGNTSARAGSAVETKKTVSR